AVHGASTGLPLNRGPGLVVQGPRRAIPFRDLELDLRVSAGAARSLRLREQEPGDPGTTVIGGDPNVVHEPDGLRGEERPQFPEDHVPEETARLVLRDEPVPASALDEVRGVVPERPLERPPIESGLLVLRDVRPDGLHRRSPTRGLVGPFRGSKAVCHRGPPAAAMAALRMALPSAGTARAPCTGGP